MNIFDEVKLRAEAKGIDISDALLQSYIGQMTRKVKNYCNIKEVPEALEYVLVDMSFGAIELNHGGDKVSSLKEGDTQINFVVTAAVNRTFNDNILELNGFRQMRW